MAAYNSERYIGEAIESIIAQSYPHWELLITDDGSTDSTAEIVQRYSASDERIRLIQQENRGAAAARNRAIEKSKGKYLAILDSDDIALPTRLEKQVEYLEANREVILLGSSAKIQNAKIESLHPLQSNGLLQYQLTYRMPFVHPSIMLRSENRDHRYPEELRAAHDYAFLSRVAREGKIANLQEELIIRRVHAEAISTTLKETQRDNALETTKKNIQNHFPSIDDARLVTALAKASYGISSDDIGKKDLISFHKRVTDHFCSIYPDEKRQIKKESALILFREYSLFFNRSLSSKAQLFVLLLRHQWRWPKPLLYLLFSEVLGLKRWADRVRQFKRALWKGESGEK